MPSYKKVPKENIVFRLVKSKFMFPKDSKKPMPCAFDLSSEDKKAEIKNRPVLLTVWDIMRTTIYQAKAFAIGHDESTAFGLKVADIENNVTMPDNSKALTVIRDELHPDSGPGYDGHCGINGLHRKKGEDKKK